LAGSSARRLDLRNRAADQGQRGEAAGAAKSIGNEPKAKRPRTRSRKYSATL
jgi:hypothetical protein